MDGGHQTVWDRMQTKHKAPVKALGRVASCKEMQGRRLQPVPFSFPALRDLPIEIRWSLISRT